MAAFGRGGRASCGLLAGELPSAIGGQVATTAPTTPPDRPQHVELVLLHVNDIHGQTQEHALGKKSVGGYARLATAVADERRQAAQTLVPAPAGNGATRPADGTPTYVLFFHAGDEFSRGDGLTRATLGAANIALLNAIGLDAMTPGNGEYYDGWSNLCKLPARRNSRC